MNYSLVITYHNLMRWVVLATAIWALTCSWRGWLLGRTWSRGDALSGLAFTTALNLQLVLGIMLYLNSPYVRPVFTYPAYATSSLFAFMFTIGHPASMVTSVVASQVIYSIAKRATESRRKFGWSAVGYALVTALILVAIPWPFLSYGRPLLRGISQ